MRNTIDKGIKPYLRRLWKDGFETFMSCQGGKGHIFQKPIIGVVPKGNYREFRVKLAQSIVKWYKGCFSITLEASYANGRSKKVNLVRNRKMGRYVWEFVYIRFLEGIEK